MDGTARSVPVATVKVSCPVYSGKVNALCMINPIYDVIIGNISGAKKFEDADFARLPEAVEDGGVAAEDTHYDHPVEIDELVFESSIDDQGRIQMERHKEPA